MDRPKKCITPDLARELEIRWQETRGFAINKELGYEDSHQSVYTIEEIRDYLDYVEEKSNQQGIKNPKISIFLGAYDKTEKKPSLTTMFLAPTKPDETNDERNEPNYDIDPYNLGEIPWPPEKYGNE